MFEASLLAEIRDRFHHVDACPYAGPRAFFENAGGSLTLKSVVATTAELMTIPDNQGRANPASAALAELIAKGRRDMATFFGASSGLTIVGESGTELLGRLIRSAVVATPGPVVGSSLEHPATISAARRWSDVMGRDYRQVAFDPATALVASRHYEPAIGPDTAVATIIHASPVTGMEVDVARIAADIRSVAPDCLIIVDGIQHAAHGPVDVDGSGVDGYVVSGYKMFARHNYGVAWLSDRLARLPHDRLDGTPADSWELGTRDASAYAGFSEIVRYLEWLGGQWEGGAPAVGSRALVEAAGAAIVEHERALVGAMIAGTGDLPGLGRLEPVSLVGPVDSEHRAGLVSFQVAGVGADDVVAHLSRDGVRTHVRRCDHYSAGVLEPLGIEACVRASLCHYNSAAEVEALLASVNALIETG